jgi:F0F1-type ATP synthase gamma subunit
MWEESIQREVKVLVVYFKQSLCGAFNSNVIKASKTFWFYAEKQVDVLQ